MLEKNLNVLEFNKIINLVCNYSNTYIGKEKLKNLVPSNNSITVKESLEETFEALNLIYRKGEPEIANISDIDIWIKNLRSYNPLSTKALLDVASILRTARILHEYFFGDKEFNLSDFTNLEPLFSSLYFNRNIENKIFTSIIDENTIADDASSKLSSLRRTKRNLEQSLREKLSNFIHSSSYSKYLMDSIITIRNDRFVIPVKQEYKDFISGAILDISASGSTVYIEPSSVFELNNKISSIKAEENLEIEKILKDLSTLLFSIVDELSSSLELIGTIDSIFAKAKYSKEITGIMPKINEDKFVSLVSARHPLIDKEKVVPIDISIGQKYKSLLITGPNTGGKTVTLKTVGLLTLMACSGILIPANEGSSIYVFDNVFADIGDEQSIQESLSTFSSHMTNIIDILNIATSNSLILLDELGSGTDPVEGSSLAISILEYFHKIDALTICTTHYHELKEYALTHDDFENASSDFDVENLRPTYKLIIGVPGKSNAFAISKKLGLSEEILKRAKSLVHEDDANIEQMLKNIYDDKLEIEKEKERYTNNANQVEALRKSLERDNSNLIKEANMIITNAKQKAREILLDAKDEANYVIKELDKEELNAKNANELRNKLNNSINNLSKEYVNKESNTSNLTKDDIFVGQTLLLNKLNLEGVVLSLPNRSNEVKMQVGNAQMNIKLKDLSIVNKPIKTNTKNSKGSVSFSNNKSQSASSEINVIGLTVDEAVPIIDKYLDDCSMAKLDHVRIIHGKGTGKLRDGIITFLKKNPHVKSYRPGTFGEGEMGVTVVYLK